MNKLIAIAVITLTFASACTKKNNEAQNSAANSGTTAQVAPPVVEPKVEIKDLVVGKGAEAVKDKRVFVHYVGTLTDGTKFDSSIDRKAKFDFVLGHGEVIKGWDQGVQGMKVGGKRKLVIPPELAYGANSVGSIPANSTLVFEIELFEVK